MIRVLQVVGKMHYGGMETLIMNLYRNIDREKVQFDFLVHYEEPGDYDEEIRKLGGRIYVMPRTIIRNYFIYKRSLYRFFELHSEYKIIHGHLQSTAFLYHSIAKKCGRRFCITHSHNNGVENTVKGIISYYTSLLSQKYTDEFWGCSIEACNYFFPTARKKGRKFTIINNGIFSDKYEFNNSIREKKRKELCVEDKYLIGHVGRFSKQKNHMFLIKMFNKLIEQKKDAVLLMIGEGPEQRKIKDLVSELNLDDKVIFLGVCSDVNEYMMSMDCFVLPSFFEGFGIVLLEAQAAGLSCVCAKDRIPQNIQLSDKIYEIPLESGVREWSDIVSNLQSNQREGMSLIIKESGFDIREIAEKVQSNYILFADRVDKDNEIIKN